MEVRLGCLSCPFPYLSVATSTDLNWGEPDFIPVVAPKAHSSPICCQIQGCPSPRSPVAPVQKTNPNRAPGSKIHTPKKQQSKAGHKSESGKTTSCIATFVNSVRCTSNATKLTSVTWVKFCGRVSTRKSMELSQREIFILYAKEMRRLWLEEKRHRLRDAVGRISLSRPDARFQYARRRWRPLWAASSKRVLFGVVFNDRKPKMFYGLLPCVEPIVRKAIQISNNTAEQNNAGDLACYPFSELAGKKDRAHRRPASRSTKTEKTMEQCLTNTLTHTQQYKPPWTPSFCRCCAPA